MRPEPPDAVLIYREAKSMQPPRCCHTCWEYTVEGLCSKFKIAPPDDFTRELNSCDQYFPEIPF